MSAEKRSQGKLIDADCNVCAKQLNSWDERCSKTLAYKLPVCESCIAKEYDMQPEELRERLESVFGMRPCLGI